MAYEHVQTFRKSKEETEPNKLEGLSLKELQSHHDRLSAVLPHLLDNPPLVMLCRDRIELLRREIELRRIEGRSERQHQESFGLGTKTLFWAKMAVLAAVVVPVSLVLISQLPFSKLLPARIDKASPPTYRQTPAPTAGVPESEASSNTATPSPEQTGTAQPSSTTPGARLPPIQTPPAHQKNYAD